MNAVVDIKPSDGTTGNIYELRVYTCNLGGAQQYGKDFKEVQAAREKYSPIWGAWTGEIPQPNEWIHMWRYKNLEERFKARSDAMKDPAWQAYLAKGPAKLQSMFSTLLHADQLLAAEVEPSRVRGRASSDVARPRLF